ncbi:unnamed protein product [Vitrella brassicaformis CCMP3155]|uniref:60S ribosomal protein L6 n=1 Tax=Vitrella brassicaformis (strain CCMP3155) TaxID=1169540 RepID=A0A0G4G984_VITBC|nr:unnamed protein product [Vitrella brassicaformis CCMP3155]|eukprot:CEM25352.1 unnamed protein product [Vitrella brassicaformis CCMP3155]
MAKAGATKRADNIKLKAKRAVVNPRKLTARPPKLRSSITPGTILILLAGKARGHRCVFLKHLPSGLLMVTGPYSVNGIPLRRVNQRYVIATSTKVDIGKVDVNKFDDTYFAKPKGKRGGGSKSEGGIFAEEKGEAKVEISDEKKADQMKVDGAVLGALAKADAVLKSYLKTRFSLTNNMKPHELKF